MHNVTTQNPKFTLQTGKYHRVLESYSGSPNYGESNPNTHEFWDGNVARCLPPEFGKKLNQEKSGPIDVPVQAPDDYTMQLTEPSACVSSTDSIQETSPSSCPRLVSYHV